MVHETNEAQMRRFGRQDTTSFVLVATVAVDIRAQRAENVEGIALGLHFLGQTRCQVLYFEAFVVHAGTISFVLLIGFLAAFCGLETSRVSPT